MSLNDLDAERHDTLATFSTTHTQKLELRRAAASRDMSLSRFIREALARELTALGSVYATQIKR